MEFIYPKSALEFAQEVRDFVRAALPASIREKVVRHRRPTLEEQLLWQSKLCDKGWATPSWPREHGGPGWTPLQRHLFDEVMAEEGAPNPVPFGEHMLAPVLFHVGTPEQKAYYLPRIRTLEHYFCQGFSEPGAGSDLAALKTRAVLDGDEWVINGQKMWTSLAQFANMMFCLVRTDLAARPQAGISMLVFPMATKGITVRPTVTLDGGHMVNEVFFDDVRVPRDSLIGEVNKGWTYAKLLLGHERTTIARIGLSKRELGRLKQFAASQRVNGVPLIETQGFRDRVAQVEIDLAALTVTALRVVSATDETAPGVEANLLKIKGSEIQQRLTELQLEAVGPYGLPFDPTKNAPGSNVGPVGPYGATSLGPNYLIQRVVTIYGGSNEIQRNIVAKSLGL